MECSLFPFSHQRDICTQDISFHFVVQLAQTRFHFLLITTFVHVRMLLIYYTVDNKMTLPASFYPIPGIQIFPAVIKLYELKEYHLCIMSKLRIQMIITIPNNNSDLIVSLGPNFLTHSQPVYLCI